MNIPPPNPSSLEKILKHTEIAKLTVEFESILDSRFINSCLNKSYQRDLLPTDYYYPVDIARFAMKSGLSLGKSYSKLLELTIKYSNIRYEFELPDGTLVNRALIYTYKAKEADKTISIQWTPDLVPLLSGTMQPGTYHIYDGRLDSVSNNRVYSLAEYLHDNLHLVTTHGSFTLATSLIRSITKTTNIYISYKELNRNVIKPTVEALSSLSGINLTYTGNKTSITFTKESLR